MKKRLFQIIALAAALICSCTRPDNPTPTPQPGPDDPVIVTPDEGSGISFEPEVLDADKPCTIIFKPSSSSSITSQLYNCSGDIYVHLGVYYDEDWKHVPAEWNQNIAKCKMEKTAENAYKLVLEPSIREFFNSGTTPVEVIAMVFRSADGAKQTRPDQFMSVTDKLYHSPVFTPDPVVKASMPAGLHHGINYNDDKSVTFVLYDRSKDGKSHDWAYLTGEFNNWKRTKDYMMKRDDAAGCWWYTLTDINPDKEYMFQYYVGDSGSSFRLHDATSELVYDPWNDKYISSTTYPDMPAYPTATKDRVGVFKVNRTDYNWEVNDFSIKDDNNVVIYEMLLRDFTTTHDINGALAKLDYIKNLGVNAVELMPIQEFDGNESWGYNPCSYFALDKAYGTREMYKKFIDECHKRGLAVIVDVVYNHTTGAHPFARLWWDAASSNVTATNPLYNAVTPHGFGVFHDLNHKEPVVVEHVERSLEYLLDEYKVDGFRFDLTKGFTNNSGKDSSYDQDRVDILTAYGNFVKKVNPSAMVIFEHFVDSENPALGGAGFHMWGNCNGAFTSVVKGGNSDLSYMYDPNCYRVGYMESHDEERICYGDAAAATGVNWGICGTITSWTAPDIKMTADGSLFVAKAVTFTATDAFKIRGNDSWNDAYNYGASVKNQKLPLNAGYTLTLGSSSQDMAAPAAGTYDIWFSPSLSKVWVMEQGKQPEGVSGDVEDPLTVKMRRAGLAAAYSLLVPGPKMIWQFGELGYDYSINYNGGNTASKPIKWDYLEVPARKALHDTYASLLTFRNANPAFFTKGADFRSYVGTSDYASGKFMFGSAGGRNFAVMGNFDTVAKDITVMLPKASSWYDYVSGEQLTSTSTYTVNLKPGEFRVLVDFK